MIPCTSVTASSLSALFPSQLRLASTSRQLKVTDDTKRSSIAKSYIIFDYHIFADSASHTDSAMSCTTCSATPNSSTDLFQRFPQEHLEVRCQTRQENALQVGHNALFCHRICCQLYTLRCSQPWSHQSHRLQHRHDHQHNYRQHVRHHLRPRH